MKVCCLGARFHGGQIDRIEEGFTSLGHDVTPYIGDADLVYVNDIANHQQAVEDMVHGRMRDKLILNVQDLPYHLPGFDYEAVRRNLAYADGITTISQYVQRQVKETYGLDSSVVYQPIKPVVFSAISSPYRFLSVGRRHDANKRATLWAAACSLLGIDPKEVGLVGNEPYWGDYLGVQNDENLSVYYRDADFVFTTGRIEGLCLPTLEAMAHGTIPVVCRDMTTRTELLPPDLFPEYEEVEPTPVSVARFMARFLNNEEAMIAMKRRLHDHYVTEWADKVSPEGVARRILQAYWGVTDAEYGPLRKDDVT